MEYIKQFNIVPRSRHFSDIFVNTEFGEFHLSFDSELNQLVHRGYVVREINTLKNALDARQKIYQFGCFYAVEVNDLLQVTISDFLEDIWPIIEKGQSQ